MFGVETRAVLEDDRGKEAGGRSIGRFQRSRSAQSSQEFIRTSQSLRRKGNILSHLKDIFLLINVYFRFERD